MAQLLLLRLYGWPRAAVLAAKVAQGKTMIKPPEGYASSYPFWDAVAWAVKAVDTPCLERQGYEGILEHVVVQFVARCSRICTHELVRHRLASYAQTSTRLGGFHATGYAEAIARYCGGQMGLEELCVIPPEGGEAAREACRAYLERLCSGARGKEVDDYLRYSQPDALAAHIMVTTNLREVLHIASLRLHPHAHWEIRRLVEGLAEKLWEEHRVPLHLMVLLKRPGLAAASPGLAEKAWRQLEAIEEGLGGDKQLRSLLERSLRCAGATTTSSQPC